MPQFLSFIKRSSARYSGVLAPYLRSTVPSTPSVQTQYSATPAIARAHFFVGNEAADTDSIISSLAMAYLWHWWYNAGKFAYLRQHSAFPAGFEQSRNNDDCEIQHAFFPIIACNREDMILRRDTLYLLHRIGIDPHQLTYIDDIDWAKLKESDVRSNLVLTDHNEPMGSFSKGWENSVEAIVDHHKDVNACFQVQDAARRISYTQQLGRGAASTCTLISEMYLETAPDALETDPSIAFLLIGTILLDSMNCCATSSHNIDVENSVVMSLHRFAGSLIQDNTQLFETLLFQRSDPEFWSELTCTQCLRYDFKSFTANQQNQTITIGMSTILRSLDSLVTKSPAAFLNDCSKFLREKNVDLLVIMTCTFYTVDGVQKRQREILCFAETDDSNPNILIAARATTNAIKSAPELDASHHSICKTLEENKSDTQYVGAWHQLNSTPSRKRVAPLIIESVKSSL